MRTIDKQEQPKGGQTQSYLEVIELSADVTVRVNIRNDYSYAEQSRANIEMWTGTDWSTIHFLIPHCMSRVFTRDRETLLKVGKQILKGVFE
jgi:hypothetical protein